MSINQYTPEKLAAISRYQNYFPALPDDVRHDTYARIAELIEEEKQYCDKGSYKHMARILTSIALYEVLRKHGNTEDEAYKLCGVALVYSLLLWPVYRIVVVKSS